MLFVPTLLPAHGTVPASLPSYSACASDIVDDADSASLALASCCSVDVVKGGDGLRVVPRAATCAPCAMEGGLSGFVHAVCTGMHVVN